MAEDSIKLVLTEKGLSGRGGTITSCLDATGEKRGSSIKPGNDVNKNNRYGNLAW